MANVFVDLPLPVLNGPGAAVNTATMGGEKTVSCAGTFPGATITVEISHGGAGGIVSTVWAPLTTFQSGDRPRVFSVACAQMRLNVQNRKPTVPFAANVDVGASDIGGVFALIAMPAGNGAGAPVATSGLGSLCTFIVGGSFPGATIIIEESADGTDYAPVVVFGGYGGQTTKVLTSSWLRARVSGRNGVVPFTGEAAVGAINDPTTTSGFVPTTRNINTSAPLGGGGSLAADLTLTIADFVASGAGHARGTVPDPPALAGTALFLREDSSWATPPGTGVPTARLINTTAPITGGGDLSADRTIAISDFVASGAGHAKGAVPDPGAVAGTALFLREDATWAAPASAGNPESPRLSYPFMGSAGSTFNPVNTNAFAFSYRKAGKVWNAATVLFRIPSQAANGVTFFEVAVATGAPVVGGGNPTLTVIGWADLAAIAVSTGNKTPAIALSTPTVAADDLWLIWAGTFTVTAPLLLANNVAESLGTGLVSKITGGSFRPSLQVGVPTVFTVDTAGLQPWAALYDS